MAKLYFAANTHLGRKYPFSLFWGKRTFHCEKHISDKTSITNYIPHTCIFLLFISYVYYTCSHSHFNSLLFIFILLRNFYEHGLVVLRQWGLRLRNIHLRAKKEPADSRANFYSWANGAFFLPTCVILKRTHFSCHFAVPALNRLSHKNNFHFLLHNFLHD